MTATLERAKSTRSNGNVQRATPVVMKNNDSHVIQFTILTVIRYEYICSGYHELKR